MMLDRKRWHGKQSAMLKMVTQKCVFTMLVAGIGTVESSHAAELVSYQKMMNFQCCIYLLISVGGIFQGKRPSFPSSIKNKSKHCSIWILYYFLTKQINK